MNDDTLECRLTYSARRLLQMDDDAVIEEAGREVLRQVDEAFAARGFTRQPNDDVVSLDITLPPGTRCVSPRRFTIDGTGTLRIPRTWTSVGNN